MFSWKITTRCLIGVAVFKAEDAGLAAANAGMAVGPSVMVRASNIAITFLGASNFGFSVIDSRFSCPSPPGEEAHLASHTDTSKGLDTQANGRMLRQDCETVKEM